MMKRLSIHFKKRKDGMVAADDKKVNGLTDRVYETNGVVASGKSTDGPSAHDDGKVDHTASRAEVENSFSAFANLVHAARRPLPNQSGDGTYLDEQAEHSSLWADIKSLGFKDAKTLMEIMKNTASGADVDDKTMLMERIIQVSYLLNK
jgi:linoleate 10R-lipoxygenase